MPKCVFCGEEINLEFKIGRRDECTKCGNDLHACVQCRFYDRSYHNQCRENQASQVADKEKSNFCEFFEFGRDVGYENKAVDSSKKKLDDLFKKK